MGVLCDTQRQYLERTHPMRVKHASKKTTKIRLNWFGHVNRRDKEHILRKVLRTDIAGKGREDDGKQDEKMRQETCGAGEEMDRAIWSYTGVPV